jgi:hypothetical protein
MEITELQFFEVSPGNDSIIHIKEYSSTRGVVRSKCNEFYNKFQTVGIGPDRAAEVWHTGVCSKCKNKVRR